MARGHLGKVGHSRVREWLPGFLGMKENAAPKLPYLQGSSDQRDRAALTPHPGGSSLGHHFYTKTPQHNLLEKQNNGRIKTTEIQISDTICHAGMPDGMVSRGAAVPARRAGQVAGAIVREKPFTA